MLPETLAAIDVGTNSFHLIVVRLIRGRKFSVIAKEKVVVRLGESPSQIKHLSAPAMQRGIQAMRLFRDIADRHGSAIRAVATSAVREASNGEDFIEQVQQATGIEIEVISGFEEARLIYLGVMQALPVYNRRVALFDIGGGSTEFLVGERGRVSYANSFKIGAIRMTQRFFPDERITHGQADALRLHIRGEIYHAAQAIRASKHSLAIATSGTAQTITAMALAARDGTAPEVLNGLRISREEVSRVAERVLRANSFHERSQLPGVDPRRADILAAGCVTFQTILDECGFQELTISSYALREGVVLDTIHKLQEEEEQEGVAHLSDLRYQTVMKIGRMYQFDEGHGLHVAKLSLQIYDALRPLHNLGAAARELLEAAAMLHDIGYYISHADHHKHSGYLIRNSEAFGFTNAEIAIIANVARYHRKSHPKSRHPEFAALDRADQQTVRVLSGILRVADGLDRTHKQVVASAETTFTPQAITLRLTCSGLADPTFEVWSVERKKGLMEEVFGKSVVVIPPVPVEVV